MNLFNIRKKRPISMRNRLVFQPRGNILGERGLIEKLKGLIEKKEIKFPSELGEEHPFNYKKVEKLVQKFGILSAIVDKHIDFLMSGGLNVDSEDDKAKELIKMFAEDFQFDGVVRAWVRQALIKGFSPLEIGTNNNGEITGMKILNADHIYVKRDEYGKILGYTQYQRELSTIKNNRKEIESFAPEELAVLNLNVYGDSFYGLGIIYTLIKIIDDLIGSRKSMHTLMHRKSNNPLFFIMGDKSKDSYPTKSEMDELGSKLEWLNEKHEWVLTDFTKPMTLDFGNISEKFEYIIETDLELLFMAAQIPSVIMGKAKIPEGLAKVNMRAWELRIQSLREEVEKVIEKDIFSRVLILNGVQEHVEIVWGLPSQEEKNDKIKVLTELLKNPFLEENLRYQIELKIAELLNISEIDLLSPEEERKKEENNEKLPVIPEQRIKKSSTTNKYYEERYSQEELEALDNLTIQEWVGFNFDSFKQIILNIINKDSFEKLKANTKFEIEAGLLPNRDIEKLRNTMYEAFNDNLTIRETERLLNKRIDFKDRYRIKDGKYIVDKKGNRIIALKKNKRGITIARTETVRLSADGAVENYKNAGFDKVRWVSALSERTCEQCADMNGMIFDIDKAIKPPLHTMCRCTLSPVTKLK